MTDNEVRVLKANILGGMDTYIREVVGDDEITDVWNSYGVADEADEEELIEEAENGFIDIIHTFYQLCSIKKRRLK